MKSRSLFTVAKKIQLKLAQVAATETVIEAPKANQPGEGLEYPSAPADWGKAKILDFQRLLNAWGKATYPDVTMTSMKEDGVWGPETTSVNLRFQSDPNMPAGKGDTPDTMYNYLKHEWLPSQKAYEQLPKGKFMKDKRQNPVSPEFISQVQNKLKELNYYAGPVDGQWNFDAMNSLAKFQKDNGSSKTDGFSLDESIQTQLGL